jgi:ubiquitin-protein ligase
MNPRTWRVVAIDGTEALEALPEGAETGPASTGLLLRMGLQPRPEETWRFQPIGSKVSEPTLLLARDSAAAAQDPRADRLRSERLRLEQMNKESDWVRAQPVNVLPGSEPEQYEITLRCRGISGIDASKNPIYLDIHKVLIICDEIWPSSVPRLKWLTPIWHPNIQHAGDKAVCVNRAEWLGGMYLVDLCRMLFDMAQYRNYHAEFSRPYPLDQQAAKWVLTHAEPKGIVDKKRGLSTDNKHFEPGRNPGQDAGHTREQGASGLAFDIDHNHDLKGPDRSGLATEARADRPDLDRWQEGVSSLGKGRTGP